jgi:hypothetical protein
MSKWMKFPELVSELDADPKTVRSWLERGLIPAPALVVGSHHKRWLRADVEKFLIRQRAGRSPLEAAVSG